MPALERTYAFLKDVVTAFNADQVPFMAAAISYFTFFSLFPLTLGLIALAGFFLAPETASQQVLDAVVSAFPDQERLLRGTVEAVVSARRRIGLVALVMLLWAGKNIFLTLAQALDIIWKAQGTGSLGFVVRRNLVAVTFAVAIGGAILVAAALYALALTVLSFEVPVLGLSPQDMPGLVPLLTHLLPVAIATLSFLAMYRFLPAKRIPVRQVAVGALVSALLWEGLRRLFGWYVSTFGRFNEVYGPATSVILFLLWLYVSAMIFLLGAEVAKVSARHGHKPPRAED